MTRCKGVWICLQGCARDALLAITLLGKAAQWLAMAAFLAAGFNFRSKREI
jgi:hypothetical protein